jgi:hypothetical protein
LSETILPQGEERWTACSYDHSGTVCRKCGYHNAEASKREREEARNLAILKANPKDSASFADGWNAGYQHANDLLVAFFALVGAPNPL